MGGGGGNADDVTIWDPHNDGSTTQSPHSLCQRRLGFRLLDATEEAGYQVVALLLRALPKGGEGDTYVLKLHRDGQG